MLTELFNPSATEAKQTIQQALDNGECIYNLSFGLLKKALEITTTAQGYTHFSSCSLFFDLYALCEYLIEHYEYADDSLEYEIAYALYEQDFFGGDDE